MTRYCHTALMYARLSSAQYASYSPQPSSLLAVLPAMQLSRHAWLTLGQFLHVHADDTQAVDDRAQ